VKVPRCEIGPESLAALACRTVDTVVVDAVIASNERAGYEAGPSLLMGGAVAKTTNRHAILERPGDMRAAFEGEVAQRIEAVITQWFLPLPDANPDMLDMFRRRNREPTRPNVPWAGEYAGKYLTAAAEIYGFTRDRRLQVHVADFVSDLVSTQEANGYLGTFPSGARLRPGGGPAILLDRPKMVFETPWDAWGQYHVMLGLLTWFEHTGDQAAIDAVVRCAEYFFELILEDHVMLSSLGDVEMNQAPVHAFARLYAITGDERFLRLAEAIVDDFEAPGAGDYIRTALNGQAFYEGPKPRWESLHAVQALAELFLATGRTEYRTVVDEIWWSVVRHDRRPSGGFGSGEMATGNPYATGSIETCCTVAWLALSVDQLRLTGNSIVADELELATLNAGFGALSRSGRWVTYDTPIDGQRRAIVSDHPWQSRPGAPELSCCAVNGQRTLSLLGSWALMDGLGGLVLNWYGPGRLSAEVPGRGIVTLHVRTDYPIDGTVLIDVIPTTPGTFTLNFRIPHWSAHTQVWVAGEEVPVQGDEGYLAIERHWRSGDTVEIRLDMAIRAWCRTMEGADDVAVLYRGPILLAYDPRFDRRDQSAELQFNVSDIANYRRLHATPRGAWLLLEVESASGSPIPLCDFACAGAAGDTYRSWLPILGGEEVEFSRRATLRTYNLNRSAQTGAEGSSS
jgi:hypothetical protein